MKYAYSMQNLTKKFSNGKTVLDNINLSYFYGAKIGVLGLNGAGKSTLLRIMAGMDTEFSGEARVADGLKVGFLQQEPELNNDKNIKDNVLEAFGSLVDDLKAFEEVSMGMADPDITPDQMEKLIEDQAKLQEKIEAQNGWELDHMLEVAMDALRASSV